MSEKRWTQGSVIPKSCNYMRAMGYDKSYRKSFIKQVQECAFYHNECQIPFVNVMKTLNRKWLISTENFKKQHFSPVFTLYDITSYYITSV